MPERTAAPIPFLARLAAPPIITPCMFESAEVEALLMVNIPWGADVTNETLEKVVTLGSLTVRNCKVIVDDVATRAAVVCAAAGLLMRKPPLLPLLTLTEVTPAVAIKSALLDATVYPAKAPTAPEPATPMPVEPIPAVDVTE